MSTVQPNVEFAGQGNWQERIDILLCKQLFAHSAQLSKQVSGKHVFDHQFVNPTPDICHATDNVRVNKLCQV